MDNPVNENERFRLLQSYFREYGLVYHQLSTFDQFLSSDLKTILNDESSIRFMGRVGEINNRPIELKLKNIMVQTPITVDHTRTIKPLYPSEARQKMLTYEGTITVDVHEYNNDVLEMIHYTIPIAKVPIMVKSKACNLLKHTEEEQIRLGESVKDPGGYFIINGIERVLVGQMRNAYNRSICYHDNKTLVCDMRSMARETGHSIFVQLKMDYNPNGSILVYLAQSKVPLSLSFVFYTLGIRTMAELEQLIGDERPINSYLKVIEQGLTINNDGSNEVEEEEEDMVECKVTIKRKSATTFILNDLFPHLGLTATPYMKAAMLGCMVRKMLLVKLNLYGYVPENRDSYSNKRVEMAGVLCSELFKMLLKRYIKTSITQFEKRKRMDLSILTKNQTITSSLTTCFSTGNWGVPKNSYSRTGVSQIPIPKVSVGAFYSYLRRVVIPIGKEGKNIKIRQIHPSSIFFMCPFETPEGQGVGVVLNLAVTSMVSLKVNTTTINDLIHSVHLSSKPNHNTKLITDTTIMVNGTIIGFTDEPQLLLKQLQFMKLNKVLRPDVSFIHNKYLKTFDVSSDPGRFVRPLINLSTFLSMKHNGSFTDALDKNMVQLMDAYEVEEACIAMDLSALTFTHNNVVPYTHMELHPSCMLGIMAGQIPYPEHTQSPRVCYQSSMAKQAIGYIPSYSIKGDGKVMLGVQRPLVSTMIAEFNDLNRFPNGFNAMVAIACYTGYNQEDSIILNKGSVDRGMFMGQTYKKFVMEERKVMDETVCIPPIKYRHYGYNYGLLDKDGVVVPGVRVTVNDVLVGKVNNVLTKDGVDNSVDSSMVVRHGDEGVVNKVIKTHKNGMRIFMVVVVQQNVPEVGDKFCSAEAQKGTCGIILNQEDMPFTPDGITPDIIINPHGFPSRMTINQIMACVRGQLCCAKGELYGDATAFTEHSTLTEPLDTPIKDKLRLICEQLKEAGCTYDGTTAMYNGMTGEKIRARVFFGPTYYHKLTHMVANKIHARTHGQKTTLTRQPIPGRSNNGGLKIGEMEKDCLLVHGAVNFLHEKMFTLSDPYVVKLCKGCRSIAQIKAGQDHNVCKLCNGTNVVSFNMPYASKLFYQELTSMGLKIDIDV